MALYPRKTAKRRTQYTTIPTMATMMAMFRMAARGCIASPEGRAMITWTKRANQFTTRELIILRFSEVFSMGISEQIQKDMVEAMRSRDELRLSTLRMVK